jgi:hypothetical protein
LIIEKTAGLMEKAGRKNVFDFAVIGTGHMLGFVVCALAWALLCKV